MLEITDLVEKLIEEYQPLFEELNATSIFVQVKEGMLIAQGKTGGYNHYVGSFKRKNLSFLKLNNTSFLQLN